MSLKKGKIQDKFSRIFQIKYSNSLSNHFVENEKRNSPQMIPEKRLTNG